MKNLKTSITPLICHWSMQIKTTIKYHYMTSRMSIIWNTDNTNACEDLEQEEHSYITVCNAKYCSYFGRQFDNFLEN